MPQIKGEVIINRPAEAVFDFVADERNEPRFNTHMRLVEKTTEGPIGVGTRFRAEIVSMGRPMEMLIEFTEYDRPRLLGSVTNMAAHGYQWPPDLRASGEWDAHVVVVGCSAARNPQTFQSTRCHCGATAGAGNLDESQAAA